jgi:hypothetical protein
MLANMPGAIDANAGRMKGCAGILAVPNSTILQ